MYEKIIGYSEPSFDFCKHNNGGWMRNGRVMVRRFGTRGVCISMMGVVKLVYLLTSSNSCS